MKNINRSLLLVTSCMAALSLTACFGSADPYADNGNTDVYFEDDDEDLAMASSFDDDDYDEDYDYDDEDYDYDDEDYDESQWGDDDDESLWTDESQWGDDDAEVNPEIAVLTTVTEWEYDDTVYPVGYYIRFYNNYKFENVSGGGDVEDNYGTFDFDGETITLHNADGTEDVMTLVNDSLIMWDDVEIRPVRHYDEDDE